MKLSEWARGQGISYRTAWRWFKAGTLPVPVEQAATGTILVKPVSVPPGAAALYARVSSSGQKKDLEGQIGRLVAFANARGLAISRSVFEIGGSQRAPTRGSSSCSRTPWRRRSW